MDRPAFDRHGPLPPESPVVLAVPHAGREYPLALRAALKLPLGAVLGLEDRHVDTLAFAARRDETTFVQRHARAWIDLNRSEEDRDPLVDEGATASRHTRQSAKIRGGLGLVPRRVPGLGDLWRRRFTGDDVAARIRTDHRPYHDALEEAVRAARARFGVAVLLDLHSMPSLGQGGAGIVLGDRFGRSAAARFLARLEAEAHATRLSTALNAPYAGGYTLDRHGRPGEGVHAIQLEIDRSLYLDARHDQPGTGLARIAAMLRRMLDALADEALVGTLPLAAE